MIQSLIHSTENNNFYIYDDQNRLSMLIHPEIKKAHDNSGDVDSYYLKKYAYLKEHSFFTEAKLPKFETLDEAKVRDNIIQTTQIVFEVTDSCNLNCTYCGYGELFQVVDERGHNNLNINYAIKFLKYILDLKIKSNKNKLMIGFYGGEALLNMSFIKQIVEIANQLNGEKKLDLKYSMTTNATLIHKYVDFLVLNKIHLTISLDGNERNHSYRVFGKNKKNSFKKVIENIDLIYENFPDYFEECINFITVLHDRNSVKEIYEFIYNRYHKISAIIELNTSDHKPDKKEIVESMFHSKWKSEAEFQKEESGKIPDIRYESAVFLDVATFVQQYSINSYISNKKMLFMREEKFFPTGTCSPFSFKMFLTTRNKLYPCERINFKYALGKVDEDIEIDIEEITKKYNCYFEHAVKVCQTCYSYKFCGLCIFHFNNLDKFETEKLVCDSYQDQEGFEKKMYRNFSLLEKYPNDFFYILENANND